MLFRVVLPMRRKNSQAAYFVQRIPADVKAKVVGQQLAIPNGRYQDIICVNLYWAKRHRKAATGSGD
jgi:hypothetical protein